MSLYSELAADAKTLLGDLGQTIVLKIPGAAVYDAASGTNTNGAPTTESRNGAKFPFGEGVQMFNGEMIQLDDSKLLLDANGTAPTTKHKVIVGGVEYSIISVRSTNPAGTPVMYTLHLRK